MHQRIADRFDLTLECIRRHYFDPSIERPLAHRLNDYGDFFALFRDFDTYVRFFLLDDLVTSNRHGVRSLMTGDVVTDLPCPAQATTPLDYGLPNQQHQVRTGTQRSNPATWPLT